ncbi:hypothetical protein GCM10010502_36920 [Kitasatospora aureofaciens]|uniref:Uncharacterized protein n=1 Tax=Kitasatospora aureofaciens TaxID=1894 RepID=A0A8H9LM83_KITAU|nr:hypothetical protein GCM10010502_36920 [Kitasatospora aureofaciens]
MPTSSGSWRRMRDSILLDLTSRFSSIMFFVIPPLASDYEAWLTELMLKSATRTGGIAVRVK